MSQKPVKLVYNKTVVLREVGRQLGNVVDRLEFSDCEICLSVRKEIGRSRDLLFAIIEDLEVEQ